MAQINTRIQQKFDTYENWQASTLILKSGELLVLKWVMAPKNSRN